MEKLSKFGVFGTVNQSLLASLTDQQAAELRSAIGKRGLTSIEASVLQDAKDKVRRAKTLGYEGVEDRYASDAQFCDRVHQEGKGVKDCIQCDLLAYAHLPDPSRTRKQISAGVAANAEHDHLLTKLIYTLSARWGFPGFLAGMLYGEAKLCRFADLQLALLDFFSEKMCMLSCLVSLLDGETQQVPYCMALAYTKSLCACALTGAQLQGAMGDGEIPKMRALVIGLGAGSIPLWLQHTFPEDKMAVDALEIDPAVVKVATEEMGFPGSAVRHTPTAESAAQDAISGSGGVRVYLVPGEDFVEAVAAQKDENYKYDMVFIDAFDKSGKVPPVLVDGQGTFLQSLNQVACGSINNSTLRRVIRQCTFLSLKTQTW
eukprot:s3962_g3.t1